MKKLPLFCLLFSISLVAEDPETVKFRFGPEVGSAFEAATTVTRDVTIAGDKKSDTSVGRIKFFVDKLED